MRPLRFTLFALAACALAWVSGCQSVEPMARPDDGVELGRPAGWVEIDRLEQAENDSPPASSAGVAILELAHQSRPLRARLERLGTPMHAQAHLPWAKLWLEELFDEVDLRAEGEAELSGEDAIRVEVDLPGIEQAIREELWLTNHAGHTYMLQIWGTPEAMEQSAVERQIIAESLVLGEPRRAQETQDGDAKEPLAQQIAGWKLELPDPAIDGLGARWRIDKLGENAWRFELPSRLLSVHILAEELDYPLAASAYAEEALKPQDNLSKVEELELLPARDDFSGVRAAGILAGASLAPMQVSYYLSTYQKRAVQLVVSTPRALGELNQPLIDQLTGSLRVQQRSAESPREESPQR